MYTKKGAIISIVIAVFLFGGVALARHFENQNHEKIVVDAQEHLDNIKKMAGTDFTLHELDVNIRYFLQ